MKERTNELNSRKEPSLDAVSEAPGPDPQVDAVPEAGSVADEDAPFERNGGNLVAAELVAPESPASRHEVAVAGPTAGAKLARAALFAGGALVAMVVGAAGAMWLMEYQKQEHAAELAANGANAAVVQTQPGAIAPTEAAAADPADFLDAKPDNRPPIVTLPPDAAAVAAAAAAQAARAVPVDDTSKPTVVPATGIPVAGADATAAQVVPPVVAPMAVPPAPRAAPAVLPAPKPVVAVARPAPPPPKARVAVARPAPVKKPLVAKAASVPKKPARVPMASNVKPKPPAKTKIVAKVRVPAKPLPKIPLIREAPDRTADTDSQPRELPSPRIEGRELPPPRDSVRDDGPPPRRCPPGALARECVD